MNLNNSLYHLKIQSLNDYFDPFDELIFLILTFDSFVASFHFFLFHVVLVIIYVFEAVVAFIFILAILFGLSLYGYPFLRVNVRAHCIFC